MESSKRRKWLFVVFVALGVIISAEMDPSPFSGLDHGWQFIGTLLTGIISAAIAVNVINRILDPFFKKFSSSKEP